MRGRQKDFVVAKGREIFKNPLELNVKFDVTFRNGFKTSDSKEIRCIVLALFVADERSTTTRKSESFSYPSLAFLSTITSIMSSDASFDALAQVFGDVALKEAAKEIRDLRQEIRDLRAYKDQTLRVEIKTYERGVDGNEVETFIATSMLDEGHYSAAGPLEYWCIPVPAPALLEPWLEAKRSCEGVLQRQAPFRIYLGGKLVHDFGLEEYDRALLNPLDGKLNVWMREPTPPLGRNSPTPRGI